MYKLGFYVPETHLEAVKRSCFDAGAGRIGNYEHCCWQVPGQGQFRPMQGSEPYVGVLGELEQLPEYRVEMVCDASVVRAVVAAMKAAHPYETPAWDLVNLVVELP
ncbi:NGG1p interacting factor NIF3 [Pseudohalioglobus lutimaris]|uniref:NGG1p interacting factor NIF3 n=1 Tax=Pseudohalioglobus lutimaris TaxID=1737061 RepID=A0A2N5X0R5_9GAMM|nr:NGG1p interacting factor NIF3 [Pseudohalioglobus lutimaris]PLW68068.1 NGG1p interacting factor NIF3 [Pseudohalioglobus lutimaris]